MQNYANDIENEDDHAVGMEWLKHDAGASCSPFHGFRGLLLDNQQNQPEDFFSALIEQMEFALEWPSTQTSIATSV